MKNQMAYQTPMVVIANMKPASMVLAGSLFMSQPAKANDLSNFDPVSEYEVHIDFDKMSAKDVMNSFVCSIACIIATCVLILSGTMLFGENEPPQNDNMDVTA